MSTGRQWPIGIAVVLAITVAVNIGVLVVANERGAAVAEPDYYRRAVAWDSTLAEMNRSAELGWQVAVRLEAAPTGGATAVVVARDREGVPIARAAAAITAIHSLPPARLVVGNAVCDAGGLAAVNLPLDRAGLWELRIRLRRGPETFVTTVRRDLPSTR